MEWMLLPLKRYFQLSGRSRRREYWMFVLFTVTGGIVLGVLDELLGLKLGDGDSGAGDNGVLGSIFSLVTLVPSVTVAVRRLHDTDRAGWWLMFPIGVVVAALIALAFLTDGAGADFAIWLAIAVGLASFVVLLVFFCLDGTKGSNRFGDDPKGVSYEGVFD